jgi:hypothetical protein
LFTTLRMTAVGRVARYGTASCVVLLTALTPDLQLHGQSPVNNSAATIVVGVTPSPVGVGQPLSVSVTVTGPLGLPTGTVQLVVDGDAFGQLIPLTGGAVTFPIPDTAYDIPSPVQMGLRIGRHTLGVDYSGDATYSPQLATINRVLLQVLETSSVTLTASVNPAVYGQPITYTATVSFGSPGDDAAIFYTLGGVNFFDNGVPLNSAPILVAGNQAQFSPVLPIATGTHSITALFTGDSSAVGSASSPLIVPVLPAGTVTGLSGPNNGSLVFGQGASFSATVVAQPPGSGTPTGAVQFLDGGTAVASAVLVSGVATAVVSNLSVGPHSFTAGYPGETNFAASLSGGTLSFTVNKAATAIAKPAVSGIPHPGQTLTFSATVSVNAPGAGAPSGTITFNDGAAAIGTGAVNGSGTASIGISTLSTGNHSITATYNGDANFLSSGLSGALAVTIGQETSSVSVSASTNPAVYGQGVTYTATVTAGATGTVNFFDNGAPLNGAPISLNGNQAQFAPALPRAVGTHPITAVYNGDANFAGSTGALTFAVNRAATNAGTPALSGTPTVGQTVTFTATVSVNAPGAGAPGGTVTFNDGAVAIGVGTVNGNGVASVSTSTLSAGSHNITALYTGDANFLPSSSNSFAFTLNKAASSVSVSANANPAVYGQAVTYTAKVTVGATGAVNFFDNGAALNSVAIQLSGNQAQFSPALPVAVGVHPITAVYIGDGNFAGSTGSLASTVNRAATSVSTPTASGTPNVGQTLTFSATVSVNAPGVGTPSGTVTFNDGATILGSGTVNGSGSVSLATSSLGAGVHNITATYGGDANFLGSSPSGALTLTNNRNSSSVAVSASANPTTYGQPVTYTAKVTAGATGTVNFFDNGVQINSAAIALSGNQAQFSPASPIAAGTHSITAVYSGDSGFAGSTSSALADVVNKANTAINLGASQNGLSTAFTAVVVVSAPGSGNPTGSVQLFNADTLAATSTLVGNLANLTSSSLFGNFTAVYSGDSNFNGSTSAVVNVAAPQAALTLTSSVNPASLGQTVTLTGSLTVTKGSGVPTGSVQFVEGGTPIGTAPVTGGKASFDVSGLSAGAHTIGANYSGDRLFAGASATIVLVVNRLTTSLSLSTPSSDAIFGHDVVVTAQLGPNPPAGVAGPSGQITFQEGGATLGAAPISSGAAALTLSGLSAGIHQIEARYSGDQNWTAAGASAAVTVKRAAVSITTSSLADAVVGVPYTASLGATGGALDYQWSIGNLPPGLAGNASGAISGTPTGDGTFKVTVQVTDHNNSSASTTLTLNVTVRPLVVVTSSLPDGRQGVDYSAGLSASGGVPPYRWSMAGSDTGDISVSSDGAISGRPSSAGSFHVTVQVTDAKGTQAAGQLTLVVAGVPLAIVTAALSGGAAGSPYSQSVAATGGTPPYTWSGSLPAGLTIDPATGVISGSASVAGPVTISITVQDRTGTTTGRGYTVTFALPVLPAVAFGGVGSTANPLSQPPVQLTLANPFPVPIAGTVTLSFQADVGGDDLAVQFSSGGRTAAFTIPANSNLAAFSIPSLALQTGTVAGLITLTAHLQAAGTDITPSPPPTDQIRINAASPTLSAVQATRTATGFTIAIQGFSPTREITQAIFHFNPASGADLQTTDVTIPVASTFNSWFQSDAVTAFGSQFLFTQSFTVQGDTQAIVSATVALVNTQGSSQQSTATIQ